jgi:sacsin
MLAGLGWSSQLPGAVLASQLAALGAAHRHLQDAALAQKLARVVPVLYGALAALSQQELAAAAAVLEGQPTVWVGNGFVPAERVAFQVNFALEMNWVKVPRGICCSVV